MKTFKEFMEQTVPVLPRSGSGDIHRSRNNRRAFGLGRKNKVSDFNHLRYRADEFSTKPANNTLKAAPAFNAPSNTMRKSKRFEIQDPQKPSHVM